MNALPVSIVKKIISKYNKELDIRGYSKMSKAEVISAIKAKKPMDKTLLAKLTKEAEGERKKRGDNVKAAPKAAPKKDEKPPIDRFRVRRQIASAAADAGKKRAEKKAPAAKKKFKVTGVESEEQKKLNAEMGKILKGLRARGDLSRSKIQGSKLVHEGGETQSITKERVEIFRRRLQRLLDNEKKGEEERKRTPEEQRKRERADIDRIKKQKASVQSFLGDMEKKGKKFRKGVKKNRQKDDEVDPEIELQRLPERKPKKEKKDKKTEEGATQFLGLIESKGKEASAKMRKTLEVKPIDEDPEAKRQLAFLYGDGHLNAIKAQLANLEKEMISEMKEHLKKIPGLTIGDFRVIRHGGQIQLDSAFGDRINKQQKEIQELYGKWGNLVGERNADLQKAIGAYNRKVKPVVTKVMKAQRTKQRQLADEIFEKESADKPETKAKKPTKAQADAFIGAFRRGRNATESWSESNKPQAKWIFDNMSAFKREFM